MKRITEIALASSVMLANSANAVLSMPEREHVQTIVLIVEAVSIASIVAIFWFVWHISTRARANRKNKQEN